jgi:hypothetical protein
MKPEESDGSVMSVKQESTIAISEAPTSKDPMPAGSGATKKHNLPGGKSGTGANAKGKTAASMLFAKKAKRASHRRQIRRSHANG